MDVHFYALFQSTDRSMPFTAFVTFTHTHSYIDGRGANCSSGATWGVSISLKDDMQTGGQGFEPATF